VSDTISSFLGAEIKRMNVQTKYKENKPGNSLVEVEINRTTK
jgi:hypothetical protein